MGSEEVSEKQPIDHTRREKKNQQNFPSQLQIEELKSGLQQKRKKKQNKNKKRQKTKEKRQLF